jgi:hypothetical protein
LSIAKLLLLNALSKRHNSAGRQKLPVSRLTLIEKITADWWVVCGGDGTVQVYPLLSGK